MEKELEQFRQEEERLRAARNHAPALASPGRHASIPSLHLNRLSCSSAASVIRVFGGWGHKLGWTLDRPVRLDDKGFVFSEALVAPLSTMGRSVHAVASVADPPRVPAPSPGHSAGWCRHRARACVTLTRCPSGRLRTLGRPLSLRVLGRGTANTYVESAGWVGPAGARGGPGHLL